MSDYPKTNPDSDRSGGPSLSTILIGLGVLLVVIVAIVALSGGGTPPVDTSAPLVEPAATAPAGDG